MRTSVRSLWDEPRPSDTPRRTWRDWVLVGALVPAAVLESMLGPDLPLRMASLVLSVGLVSTLLWRRSRPLPMVAIAFGGSGLAVAATAGALPELSVTVFVLLLPYALFRWGSGREIVLGAGIMLARVALSVSLDDLTLGDTIGSFAVVCAAMALGAALRYRAGARMRELEEAKLLERERLARDLHDTVAHHVSAIAIRAQAGRATAASQPDNPIQALRLIESEASRALTEMRAMIRLLRHHQPADRAPTPQLHDLTQLASGTRPRVEVVIEGDFDDLPPQLGTAIYRIAQESITNARRHARHADRIDVHVAADDTSVRLCVRDDGEPPGRTSTPGYGLIGMAERATLLGGRCEAGPGPGRGWTVTAVLPRNGGTS